MSEETNTGGNLDPKTAKAEAKAASAKAKALRPWFKKKRVIIPGVLGILLIASVATGGGDSETDTSAVSSGEAASETESSQEQDLPTFGDRVESGNFTFTLNAMECGISKVGNDTFGAEAQGEYCKITMNVENTGNEADYFSASNQIVKDAEGREFEADTSAMIYLEEGDDIWLGADINPGNSADVAILYDMPTGVSPVSITVVDGFFGSGKEVSLK